MRVLFAGGGTGGHVYPAIAIADALRHRADIRFIGTADRLEREIVPKAGYEFRAISAAPLTRGRSAQIGVTAWRNLAGVVQALREVLDFRPDAIVATGGYVCLPVVVAARIVRDLWRRRMYVALVEPNAVAGLTNRVLAPLVDDVFGAFAPSDAGLAARFVQTGIPVRRSVLRPRNRVEAARRFGLDPQRKTIVAIGGSQGSRTMNDAVAAMVTRRELPPEWQVLHISGARDHAYVAGEERTLFGANRVALVPYVDEMADVYAVADLVIARAGASTLGELAATGTPALLVPYPHAADDHQRRNAEAYAATGAAVVMEDRDVDGDALWWRLRELLDAQRLAGMRDAARSLASADPIAAIVARIDARLPRTEAPE